MQGGDGLGQRLQPLHLPPPVLDVVVEAISRADTFARTVFGPRSRAPSDDLIKGGLGADSVKVVPAPTRCTAVTTQSSLSIRDSTYWWTVR